MSKLMFTQYSTLDKWYIEQYLRKTIKGRFPMVSLSKILKPIRVRVNSQDYNQDIPLVAKIRFSDGQIFYRVAQPKNDVFLANKGQLLVSNINFEKGAFCIVDKETVACSTDYQPYNIIYSDILPEYLNLCLRSDMFLKNVSEAKPKGMKTRAKWDFIKTFSIPVPSLSEQAEILSVYNSKMAEANAMQYEHSYNEIENEIEKYLQLQAYTNIDSNEKLSFINYSDCLTWDVRNKQQRVFISSKYKQQTLSKVAQINPTIRKNILDEEDVSFIPMECVSDLDGEVKEKRTCKASAKGFTKFEEGDIIWAKITPCMQNGKSAIVRGLINGIGYGSTEFYVIRVNETVVLPEYVYYLLRLYRVRETAVNHFSGSAGQQRVRKSFLEELSIPVPSLEEQEVMVATLNNIKSEIITNRTRVEELICQAKQDFENAIFGEQEK